MFGKFGLEYCDLPTMMWNVEVLLRTLTIRSNRRFDKPIPWIYYVINISTGLCYFYTYMLSTAWFVLVKCRETGDFISAMVALSLTMCSITCIPKIFYMKYYQKTVMDLVDNYLHCNELIVSGTRFEKNFFANMRTVKKQATIAWVILTLNGVVFVTLPFLRPGRHFSQDLFALYGLDPMVESPNYEKASILLTLAVYFSLTVMVHITLFIIVIIGFLESQMLALSVELSNIWEDSKKFYNYYVLHHNESITKYELRNLFIKNRLRDIVKFHIMIVSLRNKVEKELRFIFVNDFIFMIFALVSELVGGLENTMVQMPFTFGTVFIDCFIGQRLIDASKAFETAVYDCKWENFNLSNQKTVLFMLQCSQKTMTLTAGGIAVLDFIYLMSVLKSTYSAYTTLKSSA
ncbi:odorant receptor 2a-like [Danaus plexippus]|uniref:odorant receptor 2a-like n=1 Tax=Danaus plexippus TaxID=13037 RepID=UPI002AB1B991|nr:odorant receptor 2a-like [Danaus plexippus]